jgi:hypothetical protein
VIDRVTVIAIVRPPLHPPAAHHARKAPAGKDRRRPCRPLRLLVYCRAEGKTGRMRAMAVPGSSAAAVAALAAMLAVSPAQAQSAPEPVRIVRQLYAPYIADQLGKGALDLIKPHAAPELRWLIAREEACAKKRQGICNIDADVLTDSQDPQVKSIQTAVRDASGAAMTVRVTFRHVGSAKDTVVDIPFVKAGERWQITDVRGVSTRSSLAAMLRQPVR